MKKFEIFTGGWADTRVYTYFHSSKTSEEFASDIKEVVIKAVKESLMTDPNKLSYISFREVMEKAVPILINELGYELPLPATSVLFYLEDDSFFINRNTKQALLKFLEGEKNKEMQELVDNIEKYNSDLDNHFENT